MRFSLCFHLCRRSSSYIGKTWSTPRGSTFKEVGACFSRIIFDGAHYHKGTATRIDTFLKLFNNLFIRPELLEPAWYADHRLHKWFLSGNPIDMLAEDIVGWIATPENGKTLQAPKLIFRQTVVRQVGSLFFLVSFSCMIL